MRMLAAAGSTCILVLLGLMRSLAASPTGLFKINNYSACTLLARTNYLNISLFFVPLTFVYHAKFMFERS